MNRFQVFSFLVMIIIILFSCTSKPAELAKPSSPLVDSLEVNDTATQHLWIIGTNIQKGSKQFSDREYLIQELPETLAGAEYIHTPVDAKKYSGPILATMNVSDNVDLYIAHDIRIVQKPEWLNEWVNTGNVITNTELEPNTFIIFKKSYMKGDTVIFGNNGQSDGCLMYMILFTEPGFTGIVEDPTNNNLSTPVSWPDCIGMPAEWFQTAEAIRVAENLLFYQFNTGGWDKNIDMAKVLSKKEIPYLLKRKNAKRDSTIDNNATTTQILFLAKVFASTNQNRFKDGVVKGINYLLEAQYPNGGWAQYYPVNPSSYSAHITFNDNAMINVMVLLKTVLEDDMFTFIDGDTKIKIQAALKKGLEIILKTQIVINGKKTAWCAQHYEDTLLPAPARSYELESISGYESIGIIRYLMSIQNPSTEVIDAVQSAIAWFDENRIEGIIVKEIANPDLNGEQDRVVVEDPSAPPIWGRFYDLETSKPFFCNREGVKKEKFSEIEHERRMGYIYYTNAPLMLLAQEYPLWQQKYAPENNVLKNTY